MTTVEIEEFSLRKLWAEAGGSRDNEGLMILILLVANDRITFSMSLAYKLNNLIG